MVPGIVPSRNRNLTVSSNSRISTIRSYKPNKNARSRDVISTYFNCGNNGANGDLLTGWHVDRLQYAVSDAFNFLHGLIRFNFEDRLTALDLLADVEKPLHDPQVYAVVCGEIRHLH